MSRHQPTNSPKPPAHLRMVAKAIADGLIEREPDGGFKITEAGHEYTRALTRARTRTRTLLESKS